MNYAKEILEHCEKVMSLDLKTKSRDRVKVYTRFVYYKICKENIKRISLVSIGKEVKRDHATVMHGLREFDKLKNYPDFYDIYKKCKRNAPMFIEGKLTPQEREIKYLYSNKARLEKQVEVLKKQINGDFEYEEINKLTKEYPKEVVENFIDTRLKTFLLMNSLT